MRLKLKEVRKAKGFTVAELARRTNIHPTTIFDLEAGRRFAYPKYRRLLSQELGVSAESLFGPAGCADSNGEGLHDG